VRVRHDQVCHQYSKLIFRDSKKKGYNKRVVGAFVEECAQLANKKASLKMVLSDLPCIMSKKLKLT